jgi:hypothetical protein
MRGIVHQHDSASVVIFVIDNFGVNTVEPECEGMTELGRFSRDYRQLFGESPSATLNRSAV